MKQSDEKDLTEALNAYTATPNPENELQLRTVYCQIASSYYQEVPHPSE